MKHLLLIERLFALGIKPNDVGSDFYTYVGPKYTLRWMNKKDEDMCVFVVRNDSNDRWFFVDTIKDTIKYALMEE